MSNSRLSGLKEPENLTGQVVVDKNQEEFRGNYSCVYLGRYQTELVAVKIIQKTGKPDPMKRKVQRETMLWATVDHPNILPFYGFADDEAFAPFGALVSPWCERGDASRYLSLHGEVMPFNDRINLWKGVIQGVVYLHEHEPIIVHGDLKPGNVLIDDSGTPRICDFGLARIFLEEGHSDMTTTSEHTGTARYLAPELASSNETVYPTMASDVYALGCLGLEFLYLQKPYSNRLNNLRGQVYVDLRKGLPPTSQKPDGKWPSFHAWPLISQMWNKDPICRPSAFIAGRILERLPFTLPLTIVQRVIFFAASVFGLKGEEVDALKWTERCYLLRRLCLVSKVCKTFTLPFLYGKIRLYLGGGDSSLSGLIATLETSKHRADAYGRYTKILILVVSSFHLCPWFGTSAAEVRKLLQLIPELRYLVISTAERMFPLTLGIQSMSTLEIRGNNVSQLLGEQCTVEALSVMQRLSILGDKWLSATDVETSLESNTMPEKVFPNLQAIDIRGGHRPFHDLTRMLDRMSKWAMPCLTSLQIRLNSGYLNDNREISTFLGKHGHTIRYLTLIAPFYTSGSMFSGALRRCPNLRSIFMDTPEFNLPGDFPSHLNLERISLLGIAPPSSSMYNKLDFVPFFGQVEGFRRLSLTLLPKLEIAEFEWNEVPGDNTISIMSASFRVGVDGIIVDGIPRYTASAPVRKNSLLATWLGPRSPI